MLLKSFRILIVDDDPIFLDELEGMVRELGGRNIFRADCGENAITTLLSLDKPVDCVLCNYGMPRGNGLQVLQYIRMGRVRTLRPDGCVLLFSGDRTPRVIEVARTLDVSGYLVRPFTAEQLETAIAKGRSRYFKIDTAKYAGVQIPEFVTGGDIAAQTSTPQANASQANNDPPEPKKDLGDPGRRAMAAAIMESIKAEKRSNRTK